MNIKKQNVLYFIGLLVSAIIMVSVTHAATPGSWQNNLWDRLRQDFSLNHAAHQARVISHKQKFLNNPQLFQKVSDRAQPYLYYIAQELRARNLPMEFILIPVIESEYNAMATSRAGAAGIWQLMPATARSLGVKQRSGHDGRRDIIASTEAALDYLSYLSQEFKKDWHLVLAAYNAGPGSVKKAIAHNKKAGKPTDFWSLSSLPNETRQYVPKILALANLLKNKPSNFMLPNVPNAPQVNTVKIEKPRQLKEIANLAGVDVKKIQELNPSLKTQTTTQHTDELLLPVKEATTLSVALNTQPEVRETIPAAAVETKPAVAVTTAEKPAVTVATTANPVTTQKVVTTAANIKSTTTAKAATAKTTAAQPTKTTYKVRKGDSLNIIAQKHKVTIKDLISWNNLNARKYLYPGQAIVIHNKPASV